MCVDLSEICFHVLINLKYRSFFYLLTLEGIPIQSSTLQPLLIIREVFKMHTSSHVSHVCQWQIKYFYNKSCELQILYEWPVSSQLDTKCQVHKYVSAIGMLALAFWRYTAILTQGVQQGEVSPSESDSNRGCIPQSGVVLCHRGRRDVRPQCKVRTNQLELRVFHQGLLDRGKSPSRPCPKGLIRLLQPF